MWLSQLKTEFRNGILRFLGRQWAQLGVFTELEFRDRWLIDPEALLLVTLHFGRYDPRLFDEVLDWCSRNGRWIAVQRLRNAAGQTAGAVTTQVLAPILEILKGYKPTPGAGESIRSASDSKAEALALFMEMSGETLPLLGPGDPLFGKYGIRRPLVQLRGMSRGVPMDTPSNLLFKLRALFGIGTRPEGIAYLLSHDQGYPSEIARRTAWSQASVAQTLSELAASGLAAEQQHAGRERLYLLDRSHWRRFLRPKGPLPAWVDWLRFFNGLYLLDVFLEEPLENLSEYMLYSRFTTVTLKLASHIADAGLPLRVPRDFALPATRAVLAFLVKRLGSVLNRRLSTSKMPA